MAVKLLLVDDHKLFREGLRRILELETDLKVVGEAGSGRMALEKLTVCDPDVVLMDINMPDMNGVEATRAIKELFPSIAVLVLSIHDDREYLLEVLKSGASGYLLKDVEPNSLIEAIRDVAKGGSIVHPGLTSKLINELNRLSNQTLSVVESPLTGREGEILSLMTKGLSNGDIAKKVYISEKTVKNHVTNILRKLDVTDRTQAVIEGVKRGLVFIK
ncbi:MAG: two component transcriptional regulator LuxR family [Bacillota bacterium]|nr:MAG: two component transcriptional regulator LuxR family [Bacillota bacterium]MBS3949396.1 response regulator transcription factor [Peptococcaceae bacterium]